MLLMAGVFCLLYLWFAIFPGQAAPETFQYFSAKQVSAGRDYQRLPRIISILGFVLQIGVLIWFVFGKGKDGIGSGARNHMVYAVLLWLVLRLTSLPVQYFRGYYWQKKWGFLTQSLFAWWKDYFLEAGIELVLFTAGLLILYFVIGHWSKTWWVIIAGLFSLWLLIQTYLWPVIVAPLFNEFTPVHNPAITEMVEELAERAGIEVDEVLVMDAGRRTTKANAYFTGLGRTKRIVLYDTLLQNYPPEQVKAVVAHEMGHWKLGHITKGVGLGILGSFILWWLAGIMLSRTIPFGFRYGPEVMGMVVLFLILSSFISSPLQNGISRYMEREADRFAVILTEDVQSSVDLQVNISRKNLSDLAPAPFIEWFGYSHPSAVKRIEQMRENY